MMTTNLSDSQKFWNNCLDYMALRVKKHSFSTWFRHTRGSSFRDDELKILVPNQFVADWLKNKYSDLIYEAIKEVSGRSLDYNFEVREQENVRGQTEIEFYRKIEPVPSRYRNDNLFNDRYRFDNFIVGKFNQFAHAAAKAVAEAPGQTSYNPLLLYGGTGLGKTHLIQAIGHYIYDKHPQKRSMYATSEKFTSDFINSISNGTIGNFTALYRSADILLVDDIQFFSGKESTQEQFFHTFNDLFQSGKQIVLTSDRHPKEIKGLEERLLSRFASGLVADLQPPELETRIAILRMRMENENVHLPEDVLFYIADNVTSNIRELEGSLTRLLAHASLENREIDTEFAIKVLGKAVSRHRKELTIAFIQKKTAEFFNVESAMMIARKKTTRIALARQVAMYLSRKYTGHSLKSIGAAFGGRDHSTVIHACDIVEKKSDSDIGFRDKIDNLTSVLQN
jgi:chromosomal replication initiator protein